MRLVHQPGKLADELARARSEAESAFGDGELILEKAIVRPRHIEIRLRISRGMRFIWGTGLFGAAPAPEGGGGGAVALC